MSRGKVLFIATVYTHLAAFHMPFMRLLQNKDYDVHAAAFPVEKPKEQVEAMGVKCWDIPFARSPYSLQNAEAFRDLKHLLQGNRFDLIHVHTPVAAFLGRYLAKATGQGPVLYTVHGFHFYEGAPLRNWLIYYTAEHIASKWTDGLIVINTEDYNNAQRLGFRPEDNLFFVHGVGVNLDEFRVQDNMETNVRVELGIEPVDVAITCVAEFNDNKNHEFLLAAWSRFAERVDRAHLLLVGTGEKMRPLEDIVRQQRLPRVHFLGYRTDMPRVLRATDIVTLTSKREGLPRCIMEGMAAGKPIVASNVRGNRDLVEDGRTGILVDLGDVDGLALALERLTLDSGIRDKMGAEGRSRIEVCSLDNVLTQVSRIYDYYLL